MGQVNTDVNLDPDFGKVVPPVENVFLVEVKSKEHGSFSFILLMPFLSTEEDEENALHLACAQLLEDGDDVEIKMCEMDHYEKVSNSSLIASFNPEDPMNFFFLTPPVYLRN